MSIPVLTTKLYIPQPPPEVVLRPRLIERLNEGLHRRPGVTLISASAGFGKTTLVSAWVASCQRPVAWLLLDEGDGDPARFLTYLVAALQTLAPSQQRDLRVSKVEGVALSGVDGAAANIGEGVLSVLESPQPPPIESLLTALLNEITTLPNDFILVLDDYHIVDAKAVDHALTFLLEHLPPQMHLVIATREDPQLPLARLRAQGQLTELRAADLRFARSEAAEFLNQRMGLSSNLSAADIAALEDRTEGWIAGLQLAALALQGQLSMQGQPDIPGFIRAFAGDHRYIVDYLVEEVLQRQPGPVRSFLLQTAILDQLNGSLCDAVTGQQGGNARLEALQRGNFFVVPLDDKRRWYRYHRLFAQVLHTHLMAEQPDQVPTLHRRASEWYEQHGSAADAIRHALAAEDFERAAGLIELAIPAMRSNRQEAAVLGWLKALPDELVKCRPVLSAGYAWALLMGGELEGVEAYLHDAERWLDATADTRERPEAPPAETRPESFDRRSQNAAQDRLHCRMVVVDQEEFLRLPGTITVFRAARALALGDVADTMKYAWRVLELVPEDDHLRRGSAAGFLGLAYWTSGDLAAAHQSYAECMARVQKAGHLSDAIGCAIALADIRIAQGRLREAMSTYEQGLQLAAEHGAPVLRGAADMHVGMSELLRERNDLDAATQHLLRSKELGEHMGLPQNPYRWRVAMARIREAQGDLDGALDLLHEAERLYVSDYFPNVRPVSALRTRVWVAQGKLDEALGWARVQGLAVEDELSYLHEFEHITLARVLLAQDKSDRSAASSLREAMGLLERLLKAAQEGERTGSVIEILVLQALAHQTQGDIPAALVPLQQALTLAEPEGYIRTFVDEGPPMTQLLLEAAAGGIMPDYTGKLLSAFDADAEQRSGGDGVPILQPPAPNPQPLIEPLSQRELEVLRLFKTELSGPEIAQELVVALSTVRTHTKRIYGKLGVTNRRAAVRRAEELGLI